VVLVAAGDGQQVLDFLGILLQVVLVPALE